MSIETGIQSHFVFPIDLTLILTSIIFNALRMLLGTINSFIFMSDDEPVFKKKIVFKTLKSLMFEVDKSSFFVEINQVF